MRKVVFIGNRYVREDSAAVRLFDLLCGTELPPETELIEGGIAGLNLLPRVVDADRLLFVDQVEGFGRPGEAVVLDPAEVATLAPTRQEHGAGLPSLLCFLQLLTRDEFAPEVTVIGLEGDLDDTALDKARMLVLELIGGTR